jgi:catechol 2,3-dioxygenase-like lactoylglutathione lyase family enzyme
MSLIHTCYRITDIDRSIAFYNALGFEEVGRIPIGDEAINVFMNQPGDGDMPRLELTYKLRRRQLRLGLGLRPHRDRRFRSGWHARAPGRAGHPAREATVLGT